MKVKKSQVHDNIICMYITVLHSMAHGVPCHATHGVIQTRSINQSCNRRPTKESFDNVLDWLYHPSVAALNRSHDVHSHLLWSSVWWMVPCASRTFRIHARPRCTLPVIWHSLGVMSHWLIDSCTRRWSQQNRVMWRLWCKLSFNPTVPFHLTVVYFRSMEDGVQQSVDWFVENYETCQT
jgi:hypothetical protein